jgi:hypothetical protein
MKEFPVMKEVDSSSHIFEEFKFFAANGTPKFFYKEHQELTLLDGCLLHLCVQFASQ